MEIHRLILAALAVWRITHLLVAEDGPWEVVVRLRRLAGNGPLGQMMDCFYCLSVWVAAPCALALGRSWPERFWLWPALSGAACLLERSRARASPPSAPSLREAEENDDVLLRS